MGLLEVEIMQLGLSVGGLSTLRAPLLRAVSALPREKLSLGLSAEELSAMSAEVQSAALASIVSVLNPTLEEFSRAMEASAQAKVSTVNEELTKAIVDMVIKNFNSRT